MIISSCTGVLGAGKKYNKSLFALLLAGMPGFDNRIYIQVLTIINEVMKPASKFFTIGCFVSLNVCAQETPEALAMQYIDAVNQDDKDKLTLLIDPVSFKHLASDQLEYIEDGIARDLAYQVPEDYELKINDLAGDVPFGRAAVWPDAPTHSMQITFYETEDKYTAIVRYIRMNRGKWYVLKPVLVKERLEVYLQRKQGNQQSP